MQLAQFQSLVKDRPGLRGILNLNGDVAGNVVPGRRRHGRSRSPTSTPISASAACEMEGKNLGDLTATATSAGNAVNYNVNSDFAGSTITGRRPLAPHRQSRHHGQRRHRATCRSTACSLVAGQRDLPVSGTLSATGQVSGTLQDPRVIANFTVVKGSAYDEPFDRLQANIGYTNTADRAAQLPPG